MGAPDGTSKEDGIAFLLGLPALSDNALWRTARKLDAPALISANALSRWRTDTLGLRYWVGFDTHMLVKSLAIMPP